MTTETINGLHSCKPGNDPQIGQVKLFVIENRKGKSGKPYIKIRSANAENGGTPHRILQADKTDFVDQHGNISFNLEIESSSSPATAGSAFQQTKAAMQPEREYDDNRLPPPEIKRQSPPHTQQGEDGVVATRKHLMQSANLLVLCINAADKAVAPHVPNIAQTQEFFLATVGKLYIEASGRRSDDNVSWWSYIDKMSTTPLVPNGKNSTTAKPIQKEEENDELPF